MDWVAAVGDLEDWRDIHDQAVAFADKMDVSLMRGYGRRGWLPLIQGHGWRALTINQVYIKEM
jgi:hypothetical protein